MTCEKLKSTMDAYLDGLLPGKELQEFQEHLSVCSACRQETEELQSALDWLKQAADVVPPQGLRGFVLAELQNEQNKKKRRYRPGFSQAVAAAAVFIMLVTGNVYLSSSPVPLNDSVPMRAIYEEESGMIKPAEGVNTFTQEVIDTGQINEKTELNPIVKRISMPGRLTLNLVLIPLFLFFSLWALKKRREALP